MDNRNWMDAVIAADYDPRDLPAGIDDLCKRVFDYGWTRGREHEIRYRKSVEALE